MQGLIDHLWQSLLVFGLVAALTAMTRGHSAQVRLWLWRIGALKWLMPFAVLGAMGAWFGFPTRFAGDPPPAELVQRVAEFSPWFSTGSWFSSSVAKTLVWATIGLAAIAVIRATFWNIHAEAMRARIEELRLEADPNDREASVGFTRAALMTACALVVIATPLLAGALRGSVHAHGVLEANLRTLSEAPVTLRPAKPGLGARFFVNVDSRGITIRNITLRELTAMAYGVDRFFVRGKHFRQAGQEDWLVDSRYDVHIEAPVIEPGSFDTYALRPAITRELARNYGLEIYVNSECQAPCGKWGDRVLVEVAPGSWALVDKQDASSSLEMKSRPR